MSINEDLFDAQLRHQIGIRRLASGDVARMVALLNKSEQEITAKLEARLVKGDFTSRRFRLLMADVIGIRKQVFREILQSNRSDLLDLAKAEQTFQRKMLEAHIPVQLEYATATAATLRAIVTDLPFTAGTTAARNLSQWWNGLAAADQKRITDAVQLGLVQNEDIPSVVRRVRTGTGMSTRNADAVVRTAVNHVSNRAREAFFNENGPLIRALRWTATLDGRTSAVCRARDGHFAPVAGSTTKGIPRPWLSPLTARPPAHVSCRSIMAAILSAMGLAQVMPDRPFVRDARTRRMREMNFRAQAKAKAGGSWRGMAEADRRGLIRLQKEAWTKSAVGQVPGDVNYDTWMRRQPKAFQNDTLGIRKADAFRKGLKLDKFVDRQGDELTLKELEARFPSFVGGE